MNLRHFQGLRVCGQTSLSNTHYGASIPHGCPIHRMTNAKLSTLLVNVLVDGERTKTGRYSIVAPRCILRVKQPITSVTPLISFSELGTASAWQLHTDILVAAKAASCVGDGSCLSTDPDGQRSGGATSYCTADVRWQPKGPGCREGDGEAQARGTRLYPDRSEDNGQVLPEVSALRRLAQSELGQVLPGLLQIY